METILGKTPAISNGHQPSRAIYPYAAIVFPEYVERLLAVVKKYEVIRYRQNKLNKLGQHQSPTLFSSAFWVQKHVEPKILWVLKMLSCSNLTCLD